MRNYKVFVLFLAILTIVSCRKDDIGTPQVDIQAEFEVSNTYTVDIVGIVKNEAGLPIAGATVTVLDQEIETSEFGIFKVEKVLAPENGLYINAKAQAYFPGGTSIFSHSNQVYSVEITLIPMENRISFDSGTGATFAGSAGETVVIPAGGIADSQGNPYNGSVDMFVRWLDPSSDRVAELAPGAMVAIQDGEMKSLITFGMIGVEMFSGSGEELNLMDGFTADLRFPLPSDIEAEAEAQIDLWHFDETNGIWMHEGIATKVGNEYVAQVSHFSWWNCDVPFNTGVICISVVNDRGEVITNVTLELQASGVGTASAYIGEDGIYCGIAPIGVPFNATILSHCGDVLYEGIIDPIDAGSTNITLNIPFGSNTFENVTVSGNVQCSSMGTAVTNGQVILDIGDSVYFDYTDENGDYSITFVNCLGSAYNANITAYDLDNLQSGATDVLLGEDDVTLDLEACDIDLTNNTLTITDGTDSEILYECFANVSAAEVTIVAKALPGSTDNGYAIVGVQGFGQGTFDANIVTSYGSSINTGTGDGGSVEITNYSDVVGDYITGEFTWNNVSGTFIARVQ